jgi:hypothetical protein
MIDFETLLLIIAFTPLVLIVILVEVILRILFSFAEKDG